MPEENNTRTELLKYPILVGSVLLALIIAKWTIGFDLDKVSKIGFVEFKEESNAALVSLEGDLRKLEERVRAHDTLIGEGDTLSPAIAQRVIEAGQTVSDQTAELSDVRRIESGSGRKMRGYIWIGNKRGGTWERMQLRPVNDGAPIADISGVLPGTAFKVRGNMVLRTERPPDDGDYYRNVPAAGTLPRGTEVLIAGQPVLIDRNGLVQCWVEVTLP
jgi:hypothetical protein